MFFDKYFWLMCGVVLLAQNCKFFAEIWAQGEFCNFGIGARLCDFLAEFCVVGVVCFMNYFFLFCVNFINKNFYIFFFRFFNFLCVR